MNDEQQTIAARQFALDWNGHGDEERDYQIFWLTLLRDVFNVDKPERLIKFQEPVEGISTIWHVDALISLTKVLIEQKSFGTNLNKVARQSDGEFLTPFEQAKRYADALTDKPHYIITCNFAEFHIYNLREMDSPEYILGTKIYAPTVLKLENFRNDYARLKFIVDPNAEIAPEIKISTDAAKIVRKICLAIDKKYTERDDDYIDNLSKLCARLVFCFYADDAKLFTKTKFAEYISKFSVNQLRDALQNLFDALNTPEDKRDAFNNFPYVDGGLFEENIPIPTLNKDFKLAVDRAHILDVRFEEFIKFSWREISPTIFGAMFESVFNSETRRDNGIHYTSVENIHKVIDPLFLDDLRADFELARRKQIKNRPQALRDLQNKLASLNFFDPACGSGNFLTETYLSLRELENKILAELRSIYADTAEDSVKVSPRQFYGIEINAFAVAIAKVALSIAENQMRRKSAWILGRNWSDLPLTKYISIRKANANQIDWSDVVKPANVDFIIGNPPFVGARMKSAAQAADIHRVFDGWKNLGNLDYVACWYKKAADFMRGKKIRAALVSTNSVCQGDSIGTLWKNLFAAGVHIDFARRTFKWLSDSDNMAHVHCVIVGFSSALNDKPKIIFDGDKKFVATNINAYLVDGDDIFVESRPNPIQNFVPKMYNGNIPRDDGNFLFTDKEMADFIKREPESSQYFYQFMGSDEFIKGKRRFCLWLEGLTDSDIKKMPLVSERVEKVRDFRLKSKRAATRKFADKPNCFTEIRQPTSKYILIPQVSGASRKYIPIGFMNPEIIASNLVFTISDATLYEFGILTSSIHNSWVRATCGYLGTSYRYSATVVYNNFIWSEADSVNRELIEESAQKIIDVRVKYGDSTLAELYNEATMPAELRSAHKWNDYNVAMSYGFEKFWEDEARIVSELMKLYKRAVGG